MTSKPWSGTKRMNFAGCKWEENHGTYETKIGRCRVNVWQFGEIWQIKLYVDYPYARRLGTELGSGEVSICWTQCKTCKLAMKKGVKVANRYQVGVKHPSPAQLFRTMYRRWKSLYRSRLDVLEHLFFVVGNGYSWLDGALVCSSPEEKPVKLSGAVSKVIKELLKEDEELLVGPLPDDGKPREFYPICDYSKINNVPKDVRDDWLKVAYEAACVLRDRSRTQKTAGDCLVKYFHSTFGARCKA